MPQPTLSDVHVNGPLTDVSFAYASEFPSLADKVFPNVVSQHKSDVYYKYDKGNWFRLQAQKRAPGAESAGSGYTVTTDSFNCDVYALHKDVADQIRANADAVFNLDREAVDFVTRQLLLRREKDFAETFFTTSIWTGSSTGSDITPGTKWDNASGNPITDIELEKDSIHDKTSFMPNTMVFGKTAWRVFKNNAAVLDRIKYSAGVSDPALVTERLVAQLLGLDKVLVGTAMYNTAAEGATDSLATMYTADTALLCYAAPRPGLMTASAGYTFSWRQYGSALNSLRIKTIRDELRASDRVEGEMAYDMKQVAPDLGAYFVAVDT